jgi:hypothetical protein
LAVIGSLSSRGSSGGRVKLAEFAKVLCCSGVGFLWSNKDGFICWTEGNGNSWKGSGVLGVGVEVLDGELGSGVRYGWYTGDVGLYTGVGVGVRSVSGGSDRGGETGLHIPENRQGIWGQVPAINSWIRISCAKLGEMARGVGLAVHAEVFAALCLEMTQSAT